LGYKYIVRKMKESIYYSKHSAQIQVKPPLLKILSTQSTFLDYTSASKASHFLVMVVLTFYGFWNLEYFISPFCISSQMNTLK